MNYNNWVLLIFRLKQTTFGLFLIFQLFEKTKRNSLNFDSKEKKLSLTLTSTIKMIDFSIDGFHLMRKVLLGCSFTFKLPKK